MTATFVYGSAPRALRGGRRWAALALAAAALLAGAGQAAAQDVLIRNAKVHTAGTQGTLDNADVLVQGGVIRAVGNGLAAPAGVEVVEAGGRPLTPALFGGIGSLGVTEVSGESTTADGSFSLSDALQPVRPEFDVTLAYNPDSVLVPVARVEGIGFTVLSAGSGKSFIGGQGGVMRLDGSQEPLGQRALFLGLGGGISTLSGQSRAAQWMLLDQVLAEARGRVPADSPHALLTPAGRTTLAKYLAGGNRLVVQVDRAADIRQLLRWAQRERVRIVIVGGAEAWRVAPQIAQAGVPVFLDALQNLPNGFDDLGATLENAKRLRAAGVEVGFAGGANHNARKQRQVAGNAVANGLAWEDGLAGLTRVPAQTFGVDDRIGTIAPGKLADLVLWNGDPLDVAYVAERVWLGGRAMPMRSRQTELRDRYLRGMGENGLPRAYSP